MSFSKARIQRFNEFENDVPPPGAYDPKFDTKKKGLKVEKMEKFQDNKSVASAECILSVSSKTIGNAVATFRTPQLPRRKLLEKSSVSCSKVKTRTFNMSKDEKLKYTAEHQIADLQVECTNKDRTIEEHEKHIEDMKQEVRKLEMQLNALHKKQIEAEEQHKKDIETMVAKLQQEVLNDHDEKCQAEAKMLRCQLLRVSEEKECETEARKTMEKELRDRLAEFSKKIAALESDLVDKNNMNGHVETLENQIEELITKSEKLNKDYTVEINLLKREKYQLQLQFSDLMEESSELQGKLEKRENVILQLQSQLSALQCELDDLKAGYEKLVEDSAKQCSDIAQKHEEETDKLKTNFEREKGILLNENQLEISHRLEAESRLKEMFEDNTFLKEELQYVQQLYKELNDCLNEAHKELEESSRKHNFTLKKYREDVDDVQRVNNEEKLNLQQLLEDARIEYLKEIENLTIAKNKEIAQLEKASAKKIEEKAKRMKEHADKMVENAEAVARETLAACRAESEERVKRVIAERDEKVNVMVREARIAVENEMHLTTDRYKACLRRAEMERAALDEKLAHRDAEITKLSMTIEALRSSVETQESFGQSLQIELDRAETELAEKKEELRALKDQIRAEAAEMVARRKRFEIIMAENQASVTALTKRLAQSNAEVERLQHELKRGEECIYEHRDLLSIMRSNSQMVHEQLHVLMKQLDAKKGLVDQLESNSLTELESMKSIFEAKIEDVKQVAAKEITRLQTEYDKKVAQNDEMNSQLHEMLDHLKDVQDMLLKLEQKCDAQSLEISRGELINTKLEEQLRSSKELVEEGKRLLEDQSAQHKIDMDDTNSKTKVLYDKIKHLEERGDHITNQAELFEQERNEWKTFEKVITEELEKERSLRTTAEEEVKKLTEYNERLTKNYEEINEKYAEVVGHHNSRQRIKHITQMKEKVNQLEQELHVASRTIEQQHKAIEKLKGDEKRAHSKGKENIFGLSKSSQATPSLSPHKSLTPLRNRND